MMQIHKAFVSACEAIPYALLAFVARIAAATPFWRSGQSKIDADGFLGIKWNIFSVKESKFFLFQEQYGFPEPLATPATYLATWAEFFLPLLLLLGLFSRLGAAGLLMMTAVIQFWVFPEDLLKPNGNWSLHLLWAAPLLLILARGPGAWSLDGLFGLDGRNKHLFR